MRLPWFMQSSNYPVTMGQKSPYRVINIIL